MTTITLIEKDGRYFWSVCVDGSELTSDDVEYQVEPTGFKLCLRRAEIVANMLTYANKRRRLLSLDGNELDRLEREGIIRRKHSDPSELYVADEFADDYPDWPSWYNVLSLSVFLGHRSEAVRDKLGRVRINED